MIARFPNGETPTRDDGAWPFAVVVDEGTTIVADTISELVDELLPGHEQAASDEQFGLRYDTLTNIGTRVQAGLYAQAVSSFEGDLQDELNEFGLTAIMHPKDGLPLKFRQWPFPEVPLVLHATNYAPYRAVAAPEGDEIVWMDASNERLFLDSLSALGEIRFMLHENAASDIEQGEPLEASS